jgi:hypothetical protein
MVTTHSMDKAFRPSEVWNSPTGEIFRVIEVCRGRDDEEQAILREGADGSGRVVVRERAAVVGWTLVPEYRVTESLNGFWSYHLSSTTTNTTAICGARTMSTSIAMKSWGVSGRRRERWCAICAEAGAAALAAAGASIN